MNSLEACKRKVRYSRGEAARQLRMRGGNGSFYRCSWCNRYHVTRLPFNVTSEMRNRTNKQ